MTSTANVLRKLLLFGMTLGISCAGTHAAFGQTGAPPATPSSRFLPAMNQPPAPPVLVGQDSTRPLAPGDRLDQLSNNTKARALQLMSKSRAALASGDKTGALGYYLQAVREQAAFSPNEDSPAYLAQELQRAGINVMALAPPQPVDSPFPVRDYDSEVAGRQQLADRIPTNGGGDFPALVSTEGYGNPHNIPNDDHRFPAPAGAPQGGAAYQAHDAWSAKRAETLRLLAQARASLDRGDVNSAERFVQQAKALGVPENAYAPGDLRVWMVELDVDKVRRAQGRNNDSWPAPAHSGVAPAGGAAAPHGDGGSYPVARGVYDPAIDSTQVRPASTFDPSAPPAPLAPAGGSSQGRDLFDAGERALNNRDTDQARELFRRAWQYESELDPATRRKLQDHLQFLNAPAAGNAGSAPRPLENIQSREQVFLQQIFSEVTREQSAALQQRESDPRAAWERLKAARQKVLQETNLDPQARQSLLTRLDRSMQDMEAYIEQNRAQIELDERNRAVLQEVARRQLNRQNTQEKFAQMVDEFNKLMDEQRWSEAMVVARQANELMPEDPVAEALLWKAKFAIRVIDNNRLSDEKERAVWDTLQSVEWSAVPFGDETNPLKFRDRPSWEQLTNTRRNRMQEQGRRQSPAEIKIRQALKTPVEVKFNNVPLGQVIDSLAAMAGVNVYLDPQGLAAEGITSDQPVRINLQNSISLESALMLILREFRLSYIVQDEVLRITSQQVRQGDVYTEVYDVADLVIPIPNFVPSYNMGLPGAIREAINAQGSLGVMSGGGMASAPLAMFADAGSAGAKSSVLAQLSGGSLSQGSRSTQPLGFGPGGMGGGAQADFDSLIELVTSTVAPETWDEMGGPGSIAGFETNLSLVVSQTQEVHERLADLLQQLRRLQDLQVTIEVRFITLSDQFFERIGVDFNFDIRSNAPPFNFNTARPSQVVGTNGVAGAGRSGLFNVDANGNPIPGDFIRDISVINNIFAGASPTIPIGADIAGTGLNTGFAILSDIQAYFIIQATMADTRTNVLQAPKVTLFNGQQAFVSDTSQRPFVTSVIPVVGDFAAAHQPVIVVLSEGTSLSVQAVVSSDRRFVRLTLVPFFSKIGNVDTFTFTGRTTSNTGTHVVDPSDPDRSVIDDAQRTTEGTTVQLPTFAFTTVTTTVSVPDGGTILLGGVKRLSEGRNERGVPLMSKIPYINRLFKNVGIGRETESLMMMVTPRIIIQEEEEASLLSN